jgi:hypothetical protein
VDPIGLASKEVGIAADRIASIRKHFERAEMLLTAAARIA